MHRRTVLSALAPLVLGACQGNIPAGEEGAPCTGCAEVYTQGGVVCGDTPSADAWQTLTDCACAGACGSACSASFCSSTPADQGCSTCLASACPALVTSCSNH